MHVKIVQNMQLRLWNNVYYSYKLSETSLFMFKKWIPPLKLH